jgi:hypothetical protein
MDSENLGAEDKVSSNQPTHQLQLFILPHSDIAVYIEKFFVENHLSLKLKI